jgi:hypothetical protein
VRQTPSKPDNLREITVQVYYGIARLLDLIEKQPY